MKALTSFRRYREVRNEVIYFLERAESFFEQNLVHQANSQYAMAFRVVNIYASENPHEHKRRDKLIEIIKEHESERKRVSSK